MIRIALTLAASLIFATTALPAAPARAGDSDVRALLPKKAKAPPAKKKRKPTVKTRLEKDERWYLQEEKVDGRPPMPMVFYVLPRANPFPERPKKK